MKQVRRPRKKQKPVFPKMEEPPASKPPTPDEFIRNLDKVIDLVPFKTRRDQLVNEAFKRVLSARHAAIDAFIREKLAAGMTLDDINSSAAISTPLMPVIVEENDRLTVDWPFEISMLE